MSNLSKDEKSEPEYLSPKDMSGWLREEIANITKELELRIRDATDFVNAYSRGELTKEEADNRYFRYQRRWGSPLNGASAASYTTDTELVRAIDESRERDAVAAEARNAREREMESALDRYRRLFRDDETERFR